MAKKNRKRPIYTDAQKNAAKSTINTELAPLKQEQRDTKRSAQDQLNLSNQVTKAYAGETDRLRGVATDANARAMNAAAAQATGSQDAIARNLDFLRSMFGGQVGTMEGVDSSAAVTGSRENAANVQNTQGARLAALSQDAGLSESALAQRARGSDFKRQTRRDLGRALLDLRRQKSAIRGKRGALLRQYQVEDRRHALEKGALGVQKTNAQTARNESNASIIDTANKSNDKKKWAGYDTKQDLIGSVLTNASSIADIPGMTTEKVIGGKTVSVPAKGWAKKMKKYMRENGSAKTFAALKAAGANDSKAVAIFMNNAYGGTGWRKIGKVNGVQMRFNPFSGTEGTIEQKVKGKWVPVPGGVPPTKKDPKKEDKDSEEFDKISIGVPILPDITIPNPF